MNATAPPPRPRPNGRDPGRPRTNSGYRRNASTGRALVMNMLGAHPFQPLVDQRNREYIVQKLAHLPTNNVRRMARDLGLSDAGAIETVYKRIVKRSLPSKHAYLGAQYVTSLFSYWSYWTRFRELLPQYKAKTREELLQNARRFGVHDANTPSYNKQTLEYLVTSTHAQSTLPLPPRSRNDKRPGNAQKKAPPKKKTKTRR